MNEIGKLIDLSVWTGNWPFMYYKNSNMDLLREKLKSLHVARAFIAPIEGILERDPMRANKKLLAELKDDFFSPVPVIDLSFSNWQESMDLAAQDERVRMVKLIPNYHMYRLDDRILERTVELAQRSGLMISIQMRVEDRRGQYPLMKVEDVVCHEIVNALSSFPEQVFILNNVFLSEVQMLLDSLDNVWLDIACIEHQDILELLYREYSLDRFLFATHSPFFHPEGSLYKLKYSALDLKEIEKVAFRNAEVLMGRTG